MMRAPVVLFALVLAGPAPADDRAACAAGIAVIRDALAQAPPEPSAAKLKRALRVAEREQGEGEFDECLDAVGEAERARPR